MDPWEAEAASPVLLDSVLVMFSSVVPTITLEKVLVITTVTELNNVVYAILKQAQVDRTMTKVAQQPPTRKGKNFIQISESMAKTKKPRNGGKAMAKVVVMADEVVVLMKVVLAPVMGRVMTVKVW